MDNRDLSFVQRFVDRTLESTKNTIYNALLSMSKPQPLVLKDDLLFCPGCGKFFSDEHAEQHPSFCEDCGQALDWPGDTEEELQNV